MNERRTVLGWLDREQRRSGVLRPVADPHDPETKARGDEQSPSTIGLDPETRSRGEDAETFVRGEGPETAVRGDE